MEKDGFGYETTVKVVREEDGHSLFERRPTLRERLLESTLPILWVLTLVVVVVAFSW